MSASFIFNVPVGQFAEINGKLAKFVGRARDKERRIVFEDMDGVPTHMTDSELLTLQHGGEHRIRLLTVMEASERIEAAGKPRITLAVNDVPANAEARRKLDYCMAWDRAGRPPRSPKGLGRVAEGEFERRKSLPAEGRSSESKAPSTRQMQRWISEWLSSGCDIEMLVPQTANRGNEKERLHPKARQILEDTIEERYFVTTRPTAVAVHAHVARSIAEFNEPLPEKDHLPVPSITSVRRSLSRIDKYTLLCTRFGRRKADVKYRPTGSSPQTTRHNEVWEIDHTTVDLIVIDAATGMAIGRPTVTVAIDRHTRMVTGFHIGFDPPGTFAVMECLRNAILPKDRVVVGMGLANPWPTMGTPDTLVPDQGREFKSRTFIEAMLTLGVDVQYTPVLKAWYKGKIERFFLTLMIYLFHRIPGTTFSDIFDRNKETTPETVAVCTLENLRREMLSFVVDVYHQRRHRGLGVSPLEAWNRSVELHGMKPLPDPARVATALSHVEYRIPQHYGIQYEGLIYNSADVAVVRVRPGKTMPVRIAVDARDLSEVQFLDPEDNTWRTVPIQAAMAPHVEGVSLEKHKMARALQRANPARLAGTAGMLKAYTMLDDNMRRLSGESGAANRRKAARYWQALIAPKRPEEPPAFDVEESGRSLVDDLYGEDGGEQAEWQAPVPPPAEPKAPKAPRAQKPRTPEPAAERQVPAYEGAEDDDDIEPMAATTGDEP
jgi:putative transposase